MIKTQENLLSKYYGKSKWSNDVLNVIWYDIETLKDPYNKNISYAGRGDSRKFSISELLVPELGINHVFYIHDRMYELADKKICGYTKEFADSFMDNLMELEGFIILDDIYYWFVDVFG